jgi:DNA-directed RNA polymerase specialized sigma24 family protein
LSADELNKLYANYIADPAAAEGAFWSGVTRFVTNITKDDDNASIVMIKLVEAIITYKHDGRIENWIRRIIRNAQVDEQRRRKDDVLCAEDIEQLQSSLPVSQAIRLDLSAIVDTVDRKLAECILQGDSVSVAAGKCGMTERGARKRLGRLGNKLGSPAALIF